jgi:hypothetical protein
LFRTKYRSSREWVFIDTGENIERKEGKALVGEKSLLSVPEN